MATWVDRGRERVVVGINEEVLHRMRIRQPSRVVFSGANDGTVTPDVPVLVAAFINELWVDDYISVSGCETAMELVIDA